MNFRFQNLLGAPYRGGNVVVTEDHILVSPVGNRVSMTDLLTSHTLTLPFQSRSDLSRLAASPDGSLLLASDSSGRSHLLNLRLRLPLHTITFKPPVSAARFSPDSSLIAVASSNLLQLWRTPSSSRRSFLPFQLLRTLSPYPFPVTSLDWSPDSRFLLAGSKDLVVKLFHVHNRHSKPFLFLGHRDSLVGSFFCVDHATNAVRRVYTISRDGAIFTWQIVAEKQKDEGVAVVVDDYDNDGGISLDKGNWKLLKKDLFMQSAKVTACDYNRGLDMVVVGFSNGVFGLYQMPDFVCIHLLSISRKKITTAVFNGAGNWLTFGCAELRQLLVWEWRSESYVLKQQGHYYDVNCLAYSPDSQMLATGADDNKIKVWTVSNGSCFVTFSEHTNAITALHFMANNHSLLSASLDGTIRAWDLFRYRNFRTFTSPSPRQFVSLASDQNGEVICAGTMDSFEIFIWSMKTGRLLDILSGHEGPVHGLTFSPINNVLASSSWDKTVRLWDVYGKGAVETFQHTHDVLTVVYRPDGKQIACSTLDGQIHFWDPMDGVLMYTIEGRRDIAGGRLMTDRRTAANSSSGKCFTSLCYSADGAYILAGGNSKYICMYDIADQMLLRRFQITRNQSLDGVIEFLNSKKMTEIGPVDLIDDENSDIEEGIDQQTRAKLGFGLPGSMPNRGRPIARTKCLKIAPTGRSWAAATTEGVLLFSMDDSFIFEPIDLDMNVTPEAIDEALSENQMQRALLLSLCLNEDSLIKKCIFSVKALDIPALASCIPTKYLQRLTEVLADLIESCPHLEFVLLWSQELCKSHGQFFQQNSRSLLPALRSLQKGITRLHQDLSDMCSSNEYLLQYLCSTGPDN